VVLKVSREDASADALSAEWRLVSDLGTRTSPVSRLARLLPEPVARGAFTRAGHSSRPAIVYRWRSGFLYTLRDVRAAYPAGIDARTAVWIWRRLLDLLGGLHETGVSHGAVFPEHVLLHPRDHAIRLVGWSSARALGRDSTLAARDLAASAETLRFALARTDVPGALRSLLDHAVAGERHEASALSKEVWRAATAAFGPPAYHPFTMPGFL
jgi:hypothetical protein